MLYMNGEKIDNMRNIIFIPIICSQFKLIELFWKTIQYTFYRFYVASKFAIKL